MKKNILLATLMLPLIVNATTISSLFDALKNHPQTKADEVSIKQAQKGLDTAYAKLYPQIDGFASYDYFTTPTGLLPVPPNALLPMVQNQELGQPFSKNISRIGATIGMPLFVKSIFTYADKAKKMHQSAKAKKHINLLKNEAILVGANANLRYLSAMQKAIQNKRNSLLKTKSFIRIKVNSGRTPKSALYKINDALAEVNIALNNIAIGKTKTIETIEALTNIRLKNPVSMHPLKRLHDDKIRVLEPFKRKLEADRLDVKAQREKLYPSLLLKGSYNKSYADAYNNDKSVDEGYGNIGVVLKMPIFTKSQYTVIDQSKLRLRKEQLQFKSEEKRLKAQANQLKSSLVLLKQSQRLYQSSIEDKKRLLDIAKVSYKAQRISTEEYLRYEDDVVTQEAKLYEVSAKKWQTLMQLAVLYTNNIEEMVK